MVARVKCVLLPPNRVRIAKLVHLTRLRRQSEQKVGPTVKELALGVTGRVSLQACRGAAEAERAAHGLKRSALRLEVIELRVEIIGAEAERVRALEPREIRGGDVLVVAEQNRIARSEERRVGKECR